MMFARHPGRSTNREWQLGVRGSGAGLGFFGEHPGHVFSPEDGVRVYFPNPRAALRVGADRWLPWGRRRGQPGAWPEGGWAREESLDKPFWTRWNPVRVTVTPIRWMEKDRLGIRRWFELPEGQGLACLVLEAAPGTPIYVITVVATGMYATDIHDRAPRWVPLTA